MQTMRRTFPGRAAADKPDPGIIATLKDSASAVTCGGLSGMFMWACILPLDVAKTRIQTAFPVSDGANTVNLCCWQLPTYCHVNAFIDPVSPLQGSVHDAGILQHLHNMYHRGEDLCGSTRCLTQAALQVYAYTVSTQQLCFVVQ